MCTTFALPSTSVAHMLKQNALQGSVSSRAKTRSRANPPECSDLPPALLLRSYWVRKSREQLGHRCGEDVGGAVEPSQRRKTFRPPAVTDTRCMLASPGLRQRATLPLHNHHNIGHTTAPLTAPTKPFSASRRCALEARQWIWTNPPQHGGHRTRLSAPRRKERHSGSVWFPKFVSNFIF